MILQIDSGSEKFNEILERFQTRVKTIKPDIPDNILHIICYDYLKSLKKGNLNDYNILKKHLPDDDIEFLYFKHKLGLDADDYEIEEITENTSNINIEEA